ncbi:hypothetical protein PSHT_08889 [Puccinia striiformis]|uniref:HORMA domain-containing protein n=1 Tax=Puccinia striiformis TaxID=27350 RepID=A0A2S4VKC0_9BASI|nr:hypothetical protein PSHT_08889 [Puccinia striiformis]
MTLKLNMSSTLRSFIFIAVYFSSLTQAALPGGLVSQHGVTGFVNVAPPLPAYDLASAGHSFGPINKSPHQFDDGVHDFASAPRPDEDHIPHYPFKLNNNYHVSKEADWPNSFESKEVLDADALPPSRKLLSHHHKAHHRKAPPNDPFGPISKSPEQFDKAVHDLESAPPTKDKDTPRYPYFNLNNNYHVSKEGGLPESSESKKALDANTSPPGRKLLSEAPTGTPDHPIHVPFYAKPGLSPTIFRPFHKMPLKESFPGRPVMKQVAIEQGTALLEGKRKPISADNLKSWTTGNQGYLRLKPQEQKEIRDWITEQYYTLYPNPLFRSKVITYNWCLQKSTGKRLVWWGDSIINAGNLVEHEFIDVIEIGDTFRFSDKRGDYQVLAQQSKDISKHLSKILEFDGEGKPRKHALAIPELIKILDQNDVSMYKARMGQLMNFNLRKFALKPRPTQERILQNLYLFVGNPREVAIAKATKALKKNPESFKQLLTPVRAVAGQDHYERIEGALNSLAKAADYREFGTEESLGRGKTAGENSSSSTDGNLLASMSTAPRTRRSAGSTATRTRPTRTSTKTTTTTAAKTDTKQRIQLKGSTAVISDYFHYAINCILYQRAIYEQADFKTVKKFGLQMMVVEDENIADYLKKIVDQVRVWLMEGKISRLVLVIQQKDDGETIERWEFAVKVEEELSPVVEENSSPNPISATTKPTSESTVDIEDPKPTKPRTLAQVQSDIQKIIRQIIATVSFLPIPDTDRTFKVLAYTHSVGEDEATEWNDSDAFDISQGAERVKLKSFSTGLHQVDTALHK